MHHYFKYNNTFAVLFNDKKMKCFIFYFDDLLLIILSKFKIVIVKILIHLLNIKYF